MNPFSGARWMDRRKQNAGYRGFPDARKYSEHKVQRPNINTSFNRNDRKEYARKFAPVVTREFRIVRDKRSKKIAEGIIKPDFGHSSAIGFKQVVFDASNNCSAGNVATSNHSTARGLVQENLPPIFEGISDSHEVHASENKISDEQLMPELKLKDSNLSSTEDGRIENNNEMHSSMLASASMAIGMYSASDPVHVPSPDYRSAGTIGGARPVGVVGSQRQPCVHPNRRTTVGNGPYSIHLAEKDLLSSSESFGRTVFAPKGPNLYKIPGPESIFSNISTSKPFTANQYNCKPNQHGQAHQKGNAMLSSKEWRPKSSQKSRVSSPRLHDSGGSIVSTELEAADLSARFSKVDIFDGGHVIIPEHLQVPEAERTSFTFGSFEGGFGSVNIAKSTSGDESGDKRSLSVSGPISIGLQEHRSNAIANLSGSNLASSQSDAFLLTTQGELTLPVHSESSSPKNIHSYVDIDVVQRHEHSCSPPKSQQIENYPSTICFFGNDQQGRDCKPFPKAAMEEDDHGYSFSYEALGLNPACSIHQFVGTNAQQHLHPVPQLYPQVHTPQFTNFVPYRHVMATPMFVPQVPLPSHPGNPSNLNHSNGTSCLFIPSGNSNVAAGGLKYAAPQYKPVHAGIPAGYGSYACPVGFAVGGAGSVVGSANVDEMAGFKYMDNTLYVPNPQAGMEAAEMWQRPRELVGLHPSPYDPNQLNQGSYLGGAHPFVHYPSGSYNPSLPGSIAGPPHHLLHGQQVPAAQVGNYQQAQPGQAGWPKKLFYESCGHMMF